MLEITDLDAFYGDAQVLRGLSLAIPAGEITCLMGRNGAGKTTTLKAIMGLVRIGGGSVRLNGEELTTLPAHQIPKRGIGYVPQGRRLFAEMSVAENLRIGLMTRGKPVAVRERALDLFPVLRERANQRAGTLSGGEQQMLAIARALCLEPEVLMLDEPTEGLQPSMIATIRDVVRMLRDQGVAVLLVEHRLDAVMEIADHVALVENGSVRETVTAAALRANPQRARQYLGVG